MGQDTSIRIAVLIGAGGSCFAGIPPVMSFFERVIWPPSDGLNAACQELARRISISERNEDSMAWPKFDAEKLFGWLEILEKTGQIHDPRMGIHIPNPPIPIPVAGVIAHLRQEIVRIYGASIETGTLSEAPHKLLIDVLDRLHPPDEPLNVFTTNYDPVLEQLFDGGYRLPSGRTTRTCNGFSRGRPGRWQPDLFSAPPEEGERLIQVAKLHGSATWKMDPTGPVDTGWGVPTPHDCLLYFGYKSVPEVEPFITLHSRLKTALVESDAVVAVGFRFGDPYIRELFDFALRANPRLRIICSLTRLPDSNSPLSAMMNRFPGRVLMLADEAGKCIPFGDMNFAAVLEQTLTNRRQADAVA
jgi:SIR2-like domain